MTRFRGLAAVPGDFAVVLISVREDELDAELVVYDHALYLVTGVRATELDLSVGTDDVTFSFKEIVDVIESPR